MRVEVEKTRRAAEIGKRCGLFQVPQILDYDAAAGRVVFERLDIRSIGNAVPWGKERSNLAGHLGRCLAVVHRELKLPDEMRVSLPDEYADGNNEVFFHGDLSIGNVCVGTSGPPITIIDWQTSPLLGGRSTYGTRYFDLLWFIGNLIFSPSTRFIFSNPALPVAEAFLDAYWLEAQIPRNPRAFATYVAQFFGVQTTLVRRTITQSSRHRLTRARILFPFNISRLSEFLRSISVVSEAL